MKSIPPILRNKAADQPSRFVPENLIREAKRQRGIPDGRVPSICILDPDGDIVRNLRATNALKLNPYWACYHTELYDFEHEGIAFGIIGCAVGAPFAVLVAEELFVSGCELLISVTSSGQIKPVRNPPFFVLIERAFRDEGTSYHYLPPSDYSTISGDMLTLLQTPLSRMSIPVCTGTTWTTDAPFRETSAAIDTARSNGILAVEMEAAALYAFSEAKGRSVVCFAHVTNQMGNIEGDFEKGEAAGSTDALELITTVARAWMER